MRKLGASDGASRSLLVVEDNGGNKDDDADGSQCKQSGPVDVTR